MLPFSSYVTPDNIIQTSFRKTQLGGGGARVCMCVRVLCDKEGKPLNSKEQAKVARGQN